MELAVFRSLGTFEVSCDSFAGKNFGTLPVIEFVRSVYRIEVVVCRLQCDGFVGDDVRTLQERVRECEREFVCTASSEQKSQLCGHSQF